MQYLVVINNEERLDAGDEDTLEVVKDEVEELLRSGYFAVERLTELEE